MQAVQTGRQSKSTRTNECPEIALSLGNEGKNKNEGKREKFDTQSSQKKRKKKEELSLKKGGCKTASGSRVRRIICAGEERPCPGWGGGRTERVGTCVRTEEKRGKGNRPVHGEAEGKERPSYRIDEKNNKLRKGCLLKEMKQNRKRSPVVPTNPPAGTGDGRSTWKEVHQTKQSSTLYT